MTSATPTVYTLPELQDSGTISLQAISGLETETCGTFTYTKTSGPAWVVQDAVDDRIFSIEVNEDPSLVADYTL